MDLRIAKTRRQIKEAYLFLRSKLMPEKIKVKDICDAANINKTTFYKYYNDSMELSEEIDDNAIDLILSDFTEKDELTNNPKAYIKGLLRALEHQKEYIKIVFRGKEEILCSKLESKIYGMYANKEKNSEKKAAISFAIGGIFNVFADYLKTGKKPDINRLSEYISNLFGVIFKNKNKDNA